MHVAGVAPDLATGRGVLDDPGVRGGEAGGAVTGLAVLGGAGLRRRVGRVGAAARDRLDGVLLGAPEPDRDVRRRPDGLDRDPGVTVVGELQVDHAAAVVVLEHGRFARGGVAT